MGTEGKEIPILLEQALRLVESGGDEFTNGGRLEPDF